MQNKIAILLPYKENYNIDKAGAASIWVRDYLRLSKLKKYNLCKSWSNLKPLAKILRMLILVKQFYKNIYYTKQLFKEYEKNRFSIEIHNRPESLLYMIEIKFYQN